MENQPPQVSPNAAAPSPTVPPPSGPLPTLTAGDWPLVPPAPAPVIPTTGEGETPTIRAVVPRSASTEGGPDVSTRLRPSSVSYDVDDSPTMALGAPRASGQATPRPRRLIAGALPRLGGADTPRLTRPRPIRRPLGAIDRTEMVWQPRFAYAAAIFIAASLTVVSLPLWLVLYRSSDAGAPPADLIALCMMLTGGYLTGAAIWLVLVEMRARVRMVDRLARSGEREAVFASAPAEFGGLDRPHDPYQVPEPLPSRSEHGEVIGWEAPPMPAAITARVEAQQASATATLEASSKLLTSFSTVLRSFGQLPAQVALLCVALSLFVGATVLSLN